MTYFGRVIGIGKMQDRKPFILYGVSGRSEESKARKVTIYEDGLHIGPLYGGDSDPLRHYDAMQFDRDKGLVVVSNGMQTSGIARRCKKSLTRQGLKSNIAEELDRLRAEPDRYHTPRIGGIYLVGQHFFGYFGIRNYGKRATAWEQDIEDGKVHLLPTYKGVNERGDPINNTSDDLLIYTIEFHGQTAQELANEFYEWFDPYLVVCTAALAQEQWGESYTFARRNLHE